MQIAKCFCSGEARDFTDLKLPICDVHFAICNHPVPPRITSQPHQIAPDGAGVVDAALLNRVTQTVENESGCNVAWHSNAVQRNSWGQLFYSDLQSETL